MSFNEKMTAIADAIRSKTGGTEALTLDGMTSGVNEVYEAGREAERTAFWEQFQKRTQWQYAFAYGGAWTDETYNPIYTIRISSTNTNMYYQTTITNTKVPLDASGRTLNYTFRDSDIVTIPELIVDEDTNLNNAFTGASALQNTTITGTLANDVTMKTCPLTIESMKSIISALKDFNGTSSAGNYTLTLSDARKSTLEADTETVEYQGTTYTYFELISAKGWNLA